MRDNQEKTRNRNSSLMKSKGTILNKFTNKERSNKQNEIN